MSRATFEVADVFRRYGAVYRQQHRMPPHQLRVMGAIERCRTASLGGHVERCGHCQTTRISYNSCRNRHCPKCQNRARRQWLERRQGELLPTQYFHVVFTLPDPLQALALQNKQAVYNLLFEASAATLTSIAADPKHLGAQMGFFSILHTWGQNLLHHPHIHAVVTGGGLSLDGQRWISCRPGFFLPVRVLSRLFRRLFLAGLRQLFRSGKLAFHGALSPLEEPTCFQAFLDPLSKCEWVVYAKPPFGGARQVIDYLGRYTHRVAIDNRRLLSLDDGRVSFQYKDYRAKAQHKSRSMTVGADEFIRRFLLHALPPGFVRIRHYGLLASRAKKALLPLCRRLLGGQTLDWLPTPAQITGITKPAIADFFPCPVCGIGSMLRIEKIRVTPHPWTDSS